MQKELHLFILPGVVKHVRKYRRAKNLSGLKRREIKEILSELLEDSTFRVIMVSKHDYGQHELNMTRYRGINIITISAEWAAVVCTEPSQLDLDAFRTTIMHECSHNVKAEPSNIGFGKKFQFRHYISELYADHLGSRMAFGADTVRAVAAQRHMCDMTDPYVRYKKSPRKARKLFMADSKHPSMTHPRRVVRMAILRDFPEFNKDLVYFVAGLIDFRDEAEIQAVIKKYC